MSQVFLYLALHLLGVAVCLAFGPRRRTLLCAALGFPIGLAVAVAIELLMLGLGIPFTVATGLGAAALVLSACLAVLRTRGWPEARDWSLLLRWTAGFTVGAALLSVLNFSILTYDSHYIVMTGSILAQDGAFAPSIMERLGDYGVFEVLAHSLVMFTRQTFLFSLAPVFAASTVALFGVVLDLALDALEVRVPRRRLLVALVTAATFSAYMLFRHAFYIHTNLGSATYLFGFCALFWLSEVEESTDALPIAFIALTALGLHRIEAPLVCVLFLSLTVLGSRLPARAVLVPLAGFTLATIGWYLLLASGVSASSEFLTPGRCYLLAGITVAFFAYAALSSWRPFAFLRRWHRYMPALLALVFGLALVAAFALRFHHMQSSAAGWFTCLLQAPYWEGVWEAIIVLALLGLFAPAPPNRWVFVVGIPAYMALILLLVWKRTPYYNGMGDSASRMAIHLVPLALFYFALKYIPLLARKTDD